MWCRPTSPYVISTESQGWLIVRHASLTCNNWYQPEPQSQFNISPYVFIYCHEIPLHVNGIAAADEFASFSFQKHWNNPGDPIWVRCWYILYHTPFAPKCFSTTGTILPTKPPPSRFVFSTRNISHNNLDHIHLRTCYAPNFLLFSPQSLRIIFNNWYQPDPHSQFNIHPYIFTYCNEIPRLWHGGTYRSLPLPFFVFCFHSYGYYIVVKEAVDVDLSRCAAITAIWTAIQTSRSTIAVGQ